MIPAKTTVLLHFKRSSFSLHDKDRGWLTCIAVAATDLMSGKQEAYLYLYSKLYLLR